MNKYMKAPKLCYGITALPEALAERNTRKPVSYEPVTFGGFSDVEAGLHDNFNTQGCERGSSFFNFLASGKLFSYITKATGLWNPRKKRYAILCGFFLVLNILSLVTEVTIPSICGLYMNRCVTRRSLDSSAANINDSESKRPTYEVIYAFDAWNAFSDTMTYILLIYTLWRAQKQMPLLSLASVEAKVSSHEWLFINLMLIICSVVITVATAFRVSISESSKMKLNSTFGLSILIVYLTAILCSGVFAVLACALRSLVDVCLQEICSMSHASLYDAIAVHRKLLGQLTTGSHILTPWFLVHWLMFGAYCLAVFAFDSMHFEVLTHNFRGAQTTFMAVSFVLNFAIFVVPCVFASRVTWKCEDFLFKLNNMAETDWNEGHPFCDRANVNAFLFYAERSKCGFRIRNTTFGSSATWISVLLGLFGLGVRLVQYIA